MQKRATEKQSQQGVQNLTLATNIHFILPVLIRRAFTKSTAEKPAQVSCLKFPGRAFFFSFALFKNPALFALDVTIASLAHGQKIELPLDMNGNRPPALFVTLHRF